MELYFKYLEGVQQADKRIEGEKHVGVPFFSPDSLPPSVFSLFPFYTADHQVDLFKSSSLNTSGL